MLDLRDKLTGGSSYFLLQSCSLVDLKFLAGRNINGLNQGLCRLKHGLFALLLSPCSAFFHWIPDKPEETSVNWASSQSRLALFLSSPCWGGTTSCDAILETLNGLAVKVPTEAACPLLASPPQQGANRPQRHVGLIRNFYTLAHISSVPEFNLFFKMGFWSRWLTI